MFVVVLYLDCVVFFFIFLSLLELCEIFELFGFGCFSLLVEIFVLVVVCFICFKLVCEGFIEVLFRLGLLWIIEFE